LAAKLLSAICPLLADCVEKVGGSDWLGPRRGFACSCKHRHELCAFGASDRWRHLRPGWDGQFGELSQVLGGGGQQELISGFARASQPQTPHPQDPLEVSKEDLDTLAALP
jgi:hypothetical protein